MLHFHGSAGPDGFLVVATTARSQAERFFEELMLVNNEQANRLRETMKELTLQSRGRAERDEQLYEELSGLNNELVTLQRELAKKNQELQALNEQKNHFLGMASHDLRTPLGTIMGFSNFLLEEAGPSLSAEHVELLTIIRTASKTMLDLVDDLLDIAKIESGKLSLEREPTDLAALVGYNVTLNRVLAEKKQIRMQFLPAADLPAVSLDPDRMQQVISNLLSNAVKYSPPGTTVDVTLAQDDGDVVLSVRDEGYGIPADKLDKLFTPFMRVSTKSPTGEKSTGLGLAIVRKIVEAHGGRVWVESQQGQGSTFHVTLPAVTASEPR